MFEGRKKILVTAALGVGLLALVGCYTQVRLFTRVSEQPPMVGEAEEGSAPEHHYYYYYRYDSRWDDPFWYRWRSQRPYSLRGWQRWDYRDRWERYDWYDPWWDYAYWGRTYDPWYGFSYHRRDYYDYPGYYSGYYDPWWGQSYYREDKPNPSREREPDSSGPRVFSETEKVLPDEVGLPLIRSRPESRSEKRIVEPKTSTEQEKTVERKKVQTSTTEKKEEKKDEKEEETSNRRRDPSSEKARER